MNRLALLGAVLLLAGCGSAAPSPPKAVRPHLPRALAADWAQQADAVATALAAGDGCLAQQRAAALQAAVIEAIDAHRVGARFQEPLQSAVNDLAGRITCTEPPAPAQGDQGDEGNGHGHGHGHGKGHGKHEGHDG